MIYNFEELSFQIMTISSYTHKNGYYSVSGRPYSALSFRVSGTVDFEVDNTSFTSAPGSVIFIPKNSSYNAKYSDGESIVVHFFDCNYYNAEIIELKHSEIIYKEFKNLLVEWEKNYSVNRAKASIFNIFDLIYGIKLRTKDDSGFEDCISYISENYANPNININDICNLNHISESTLNRKFKNYYNVSPKQYILKLRLEKAVKLLIEGKYSVKQVSDICGFCDEKYFSRTIKKKFGQPPSYIKKGSTI